MTSFMDCCREMTDSRWIEFWLSHGIRVGARGATKGQPCPNCAGHDRFIWDNKHGDGSYHCRGCGAGNGIELVKKTKHLTYDDVFVSLKDFLGIAPAWVCPMQGDFDLDEYEPAKKTHPYLVDKGLEPHGLLQSGDNLLVILGDYNNPATTLQMIDNLGNKMYPKGAKVKGKFHTIQGGEATILICEGWSTGARLFEATGHTVICAMSAAQMESAARQTQKRNPSSVIVVCADNDVNGNKNAGVEGATKAAQSIKGLIAVPPPGDFADILDHDLVREILDKAEEPQSLADMSDVIMYEMNKRYAFIATLGKAVLMDFRDPDNITYISVGAVKELYRNEPIQIAGKYKNPVDYFMEHPNRRTYQGIVFEPEGKTKDDVYNLWTGWHVGRNIGKCDTYFEHIERHIGSNYAPYIHHWFADMFQNPCDKPGVALVLRGRQGVGKSILGETCIGPIVGKSYQIIDDERYLTGNFNSMQENCLLLQVEEAFWAGGKKSEGRLKSLITSRTNMIEHKGLNPFTVDNHMRIFITSNSTWVVPAAMDDRRFAIFDVAWPGRIDRTFFVQLINEMNDGGREALLEHYKNLDLSKVDLRDIPNTTARGEQKSETFVRDPLHRWIVECLSRGYWYQGWKWEEVMYPDDFHRLFEDWKQEKNIPGMNYRTRQAVTRELNKIFGRICMNSRFSKMQGTIMKKCFLFNPHAQCLEQAEKTLGFKIELDFDSDYQSEENEEVPF